MKTESMGDLMRRAEKQGSALDSTGAVAVEKSSSGYRVNGKYRGHEVTLEMTSRVNRNGEHGYIVSIQQKPKGRR